MRRLFAIVMALILSITCASCGKKTTVNEKKNNSEAKLVEDSEYIEKEQIVSGTPFTNDFALVMTENEEIYGIDSKGRIKFKLDGDFMFHDSCIYGNGLISLGDKERMDNIICDSEGNLYLAESYGGTGFDPGGWGDAIRDSFSDGIILVYNGETKELGVLDTEFNWLVELSSEFYALYDDFYATYYYSGYLMNREHSLLNLRNGEIYEGSAPIETEHPLDFHSVNASGEQGVVRNELTGEIVFTVEKKESSFSNVLYKSWFENGMAVIQDYLNIDGETISRFYVIDENGNYAIEPTVILKRKDGSIRCSALLNGNYVLVQSANAENSSISPYMDKLEIYAVNGEKVAEIDICKEVPVENLLSMNIAFNDGIVRLAYAVRENGYMKKYCCYYTSELKELF